MRAQSQEEIKRTPFFETEEEENEYTSPEQTEYVQREQIRRQVRKEKHRGPAFYLLTYGMTALLALGAFGVREYMTHRFPGNEPVLVIGYGEGENLAALQAKGTVFQLPATVQEFLDDGWNVDVKDNDKRVVGVVPSDERYDVVLYKENCMITGMTQWEWEGEMVPVEDLRISYLYVDRYSADVQLPMGIELGMDAETAEEILEENTPSFEKYGDSSWYYYDVDGDDYNVSIYTYEGEVSGISVSYYGD